MTDKQDIYTPISCGQHSEYELAVMHKLMLQLVWKDETGQPHLGKVMPLDLKTEAKQEFLIGQTNDGEVHYIRLDKISHSDVHNIISSVAKD